MCRKPTHYRLVSSRLCYRIRIARVLSFLAKPQAALALILGLALLVGASPLRAANDIQLPVLGDTSSGVISQQQEYELGRAWLQLFRSRVPTYRDPQLQDYLEQLLFKLSTHSELSDHRLDLIIVNNPTMNAFAVPGGVVGVHTGLFRYARNEHQLASVITHELAHLSQRHFARRVAQQRANTMPMLAGMLTGLILAATVGGDAGMAVLATTQAAAIESSLRYSRQNEQEADRLGLETLVGAGMDPTAVAAMFERMMIATRYTGQRPPEFLLSHPLTEQRVADARNRINKYPKRQFEDNLEYQLMRARALIGVDQNAQKSANRFNSELEGHSYSLPAARYGLALSLSALGKHQEARDALRPLLDNDPERLTYQLAAIEIERNAGANSAALALIKSLIKSHPNNYPLQMELAETLLKDNQYSASEKVLADLTRIRPADPDIWFDLAETSGLAGDIIQVHKARAEYYLLVGVFDKARDQLTYAQKLAEYDFKESAIIAQRLRDLAAMEEKTKKL